MKTHSGLKSLDRIIFLKQKMAHIPVLTIFERASIVGLRAQQLENGATPRVKCKPSMTDPVEIAEFELLNRCIPFNIHRTLSNGKVIVYKLGDLALGTEVICP